ncbi:uncharacterized protein J3D65DRAFT_336188 [Phyllosticta citribraziliensis]|uniref:Uncharacterized protein n=1 Tax=Phyllosticta citribraziliensis TaxID=989973 RepID=A0ABR1LVS2_9PEZI
MTAGSSSAFVPQRSRYKCTILSFQLMQSIRRTLCAVLLLYSTHAAIPITTGGGNTTHNSIITTFTTSLTHPMPPQTPSPVSKALSKPPSPPSTPDTLPQLPHDLTRAKLPPKPGSRPPATRAPLPIQARPHRRTARSPSGIAVCSCSWLRFMMQVHPPARMDGCPDRTCPFLSFLFPCGRAVALGSGCLGRLAGIEGGRCRQMWPGPRWLNGGRGLVGQWAATNGGRIRGEE